MARQLDDAQSQYCEVDDPVGITGPPFWISAWIYPDAAVTQTICFLGNKDTAADCHQLSVLSSGGVRACSATTTDGFACAETLGTVTWNKWHHVMGLWVADNQRRVYLNGMPRVNYTARSVSGLDRTSIGRSGYSTPDGYFSGRIAEVAVGTGIPTDPQVASLAKAFDPRLVFARSSLKALWRFLDDDEDLLGQYHLTAYNTPSWAEHPPLIYPSRWRAAVLRASSPERPPSYRAAAGQVWHPGATAGQLYVTGQLAGQIHG